MKRLLIMIVLFSIATLGLPTQSFAQRGAMNWRGSGGWDPGTPYNRVYELTKVETLSGTVLDVNIIVPAQGMDTAVAVTLKTNEETISIHLGPEWYIGRLDMEIVKGDTIEVKGSRVKFADKPGIIVAEVKKDDNVLVLRDSAGIPIWSGWRR